MAVNTMVSDDVFHPNIIFSALKFRKDVRRKLELKLTHPFNYVAALPCEK